MTNNTWAKTILTAYRHLERISDAIDRIVDTKASNSFYMCGNNFSENNVLAVCESLIKLGERKKTLINLKLLCEEALKVCYGRDLLIEKYIDGDKGEGIALRHNLTERTYFRRLSSAEESFSSILNMLGYSDQRLAKNLANEKWICEIYKGFCLKGQKLEISESRINRLAVS